MKNMNSVVEIVFQELDVSIYLRITGIVAKIVKRASKMVPEISEQISVGR
jgi:hypothetical protein